MRERTEIVALLGPTNTGKTHRAIERMLEHESGMMGLPLRLLAREVYDKVSARVGQERVALITGEERRVPAHPAYFIATTEAMPVQREVDFFCVDEVQLAAHPERGHVVTERLLHGRGRKETWFLGSHSMKSLMAELVPAAKIQEHPRLSRLQFTDAEGLGRVGKRSAIVAFSSSDVYETAERLRRSKGGAAVVMGALSPRARNAQVGLFENGEVDYLVATDAIGMGLNLDIHHVAFRSLRKFDGREERELEPSELAQVAGRAGRYLRDGTFGTLLPSRLPRRLAHAIEHHLLPDVRRVYYRNFDLRFDDVVALQESLRARPPRGFMLPLANATDHQVLARLVGDPAFGRLRGEDLKLLWEACQIPEYRELLPESHQDLVRRVFAALREGALSDDFMDRETRALEQTHHDEATLLARIADVRTWSYVAHKPGWVEHAEAWQRRAEGLEDALSMALHQRLVARFVDTTRRKVVLPPPAPSSARDLGGKSKNPDRPSGRGLAALAQFSAQLGSPQVGSALGLEQVATELVDAPHDALSLSLRVGPATPSAVEIYDIQFRGVRVGTLSAGTELLLPNVTALLATTREQKRVQKRLLAYARDLTFELLGELRVGLEASARLRGIRYALERGLGLTDARGLRADLVETDDDEKRALAQAGVEWGHYCVYGAYTTTPSALRLRRALVSAFAACSLPPLQPVVPATEVGTWAWALGYVPWGKVAVQAPLLEEVVTTFSEEGQVPIELATLLGVPAERVAERLVRDGVAPPRDSMLPPRQA
jgi:ATP-dependent RNA helicase SUPV3L1/SUV3